MAIKTNSGFFFNTEPPNEWNGAEAETLRLRLALTQAQFGEYVLGCSEGTVRKIEKAGVNYRFKSKLQRESMDAYLREVQRMENEGPVLDKRWGSKLLQRQ